MSETEVGEPAGYGEAAGRAVVGGLLRAPLRDKVRDWIYQAPTMLEEDEDPDQQRANQVGKVVGKAADLAIGGLAAAAAAEAGPVASTGAYIASGAVSGAVCPVVEVYAAEYTKVVTGNIEAVRAAARESPVEVVKAALRFHPTYMAIQTYSGTAERIGKFFQNR